MFRIPDRVARGASGTARSRLAKEFQRRSSDPTFDFSFPKRSTHCSGAAVLLPNKQQNVGAGRPAHRYLRALEVSMSGGHINSPSETPSLAFTPSHQSTPSHRPHLVVTPSSAAGLPQSSRVTRNTLISLELYLRIYSNHQAQSQAYHSCASPKWCSQ